MAVTNNDVLQFILVDDIHKEKPAFEVLDRFKYQVSSIIVFSVSSSPFLLNATMKARNKEVVKNYFDIVTGDATVIILGTTPTKELGEHKIILLEHQQ